MYLAACTQPKWPNQVGSLDFWGSVYNFSIRSSLAGHNDLGQKKPALYVYEGYTPWINV